MLDSYQFEQPISYKILINSIQNNKLSHAYLFETNNCQNGLDIAISFAKYVLCEKHYLKKSQCQSCNQCLQIDNRNFSNLKIIDSDGAWIKKEQLDDLQKEFSEKALNNNKQIYIINHAEKMNVQSSNSILKFLEEPQPDIVAILVVNNKHSLLDTIVSRCQIISLKRQQIIINNGPISKFANIYYNNKKEIQEFIDNRHGQEMMENVLKFVIFYEKNGLDTLLFLNKYWHSIFKEKSDILIAFSMMILFYKDILNVKIGTPTSIFELDDTMNYVIENNTIHKLCGKIETLIKQKEKIQFNINSSLLMDDLIMEMEK